MTVTWIGLWWSIMPDANRLIPLWKMGIECALKPLRLYEPNTHFSLDELPFFGCPQLRQHVVKR